MRPGPVVRSAPGRWVPPLLTAGFSLTVSPRCSPLFTVMLVHGWYMDPLHRSTTLRGGCFGAIGEKAGFSPQLDAPRVPPMEVHFVADGRQCVEIDPRSTRDYRVLGLGRSRTRSRRRSTRLRAAISSGRRRGVEARMRLRPNARTATLCVMPEPPTNEWERTYQASVEAERLAGLRADELHAREWRPCRRRNVAAAEGSTC